MALIAGEPREDITARFVIAQDNSATVAETEAQRNLRLRVVNAAQFLNNEVADSREKSLALTHLEEALMWAGKAIFKARE